jgi:hypothetical protein
MRNPISVSLDLEAGAGYVEYLVDGEIVETLDVWRDGVVAADLDAAGNVVGIELLAFDVMAIDAARTFAAKKRSHISHTS